MVVVRTSIIIHSWYFFLLPVSLSLSACLWIRDIGWGRGCNDVVEYLARIRIRMQLLVLDNYNGIGSRSARTGGAAPGGAAVAAAAAVAAP